MLLRGMWCDRDGLHISMHLSESTICKSMQKMWKIEIRAKFYVNMCIKHNIVYCLIRVRVKYPCVSASVTLCLSFTVCWENSLKNIWRHQRRGGGFFSLNVRMWVILYENFVYKFTVIPIFSSVFHEQSNKV